TKPARVGLIMAFGAGAVISAVSTDLVSVAYNEAGAGPTALGIGIGGLGYFLIVSLLERSGNSEKAAVVIEKADERADHEVEGASPTEARNLLIGMVVDGVPESVSIGLTLHLGSIGVSAALVGSVFIAGLPEAIGVAAALLAGGFTLPKILARFSVIVLIGAVAGAFGYGSLVNAPRDVIAIIQAIAAGALLVVVVNEMIPIAVRGAKRWAGVLAACGFVFAAGMTWITG
ncbi:MAG: ZIP family metal transporter, partial [Burkholderiales bacterium]